MSITISLAEDRHVRVTEETVDARPPDHITFVVEGVITMTEDLLGTFEGATLKPTRVDLAVDGSRTVEIDLAEESTLRLESVDVGVETPGTGDVSPGGDSDLPSSVEEAEPGDGRPGTIAFTVEGVIGDVSTETLEAVSEGTATVASVTFAVTDAARSDGGSAGDVVIDITLLGHRVVVRRGGTIEIGVRGGGTGAGLL